MLHCKKKQGYSLIEVLVTLMVISMGILAISTLMANNIKDSNNARDQIVAAQLAQEGLELVHNLKDSGKLSNTPYDVPGTVSGTVDAKYPDNPLSAGSTQLNIAGGFFTHDAGTATKYRRNVNVVITGTIAANNRVMVVTSTVWWGGATKPATCNSANKCIAVISEMRDVN